LDFPGAPVSLEAASAFSGSRVGCYSLDFAGDTPAATISRRNVDLEFKWQT